MASRKHLLFPVETSNRELDYRLAMAVMAARGDNRIYIGLHETLMRLASRLTGGVYLGKGAIRPHAYEQLDDYHLLKERGFIVAHFDTEGAIYPGAEQRWKKILYQRLDPRILEREDYICTWGDFQRDVYRALDPVCAANIRTTGHPRFDLYKREWREYYAAEVAELRDRFGDFVLINTNFTHANNKLGTDFVFSPGSGFHPGDLESRLNTVRDWAYMNKQLSHYVRLVQRLHAVLPGLPIVVRPHPTEDPAFYRSAFEGLSSVHVLYEGPVGPWLIASRCMIHDGCTTGVEAHLSGAKIINYRPIDDAGRDFYLPNLFGLRCTAQDEVVDCLRDIRADRRTQDFFDDSHRIGERARKLLNNLSQDSFPMMLEILDEAQSKVSYTESPPDVALHVEEAFYEALEATKNVLRPLSPRHRRAAEYSRRKFPGFDPVEVERSLRRLQTIAGKEVTHRVVSRGLMIVEAK